HRPRISSIPSGRRGGTSRPAEMAPDEREREKPADRRGARAMSLTRTRGAAAVLAIALGMACSLPAASWAAAERHSGTVVDVNRDTGMLVLGEVGPWKGTEGPTEVKSVTIALPPSTPMTVVSRANGTGPGGYIGEYVVRPSTASLRQGEFVTIAVTRSGSALTAQ